MSRVLMKIILKLDNFRIIRIKDSVYIKILYKYRMGKKINLNNPKTFNEKINWLKLCDRKDIYTKMADKYEVKQFISETIGDEYVIPLIGIYDSFDDIDFDKLPNRFVIKCTHDSGGLVICKNKKELNIDDARSKIQKSLKRNYYLKGREWPYKNIKPRILIEKFIEDDMIDDLRDYKFMCFNGRVKYVYVTVKNDNIWENYYDANFKPVDVNHGFPRYNEEFAKPKNFHKMVRIAERLAKNTPFLRVDLHNIKGEILFGEMTFYDWGGLRAFADEKFDVRLGNLIDIGMVKKNEK